ncbi:MAG: TlpA family protein disulfide reductase [Chitinophagaceae bacterium]|nr:MAG: TlpA family protein disulfide reductase [Chitinophagaceae bacterium]
MRQASLKILLLLFLFSCKEPGTINEIILEGHVQNIPDGKIYLSEAHNWQTPLYWAESRDGRFKFRIKPDSLFVPFMAAIHFADSTKPSKVGGLFFRNYMFGADSAKHTGDAFYLEKGYTRIEGNNRKPPFLRVFAGRETDIFFKHQRTDFGWPGNQDSANRFKRIAFFKEEIKKHPFSYFLLQSIYANKEHYAEKELVEILSLFDKEVQASTAADQIRFYLANRTDPGQPLPNLRLVNTANKRVPLLDSNAKLNMLVFWASWCGPCRLEIPVLKEIQKEYSNKGLRLVSISIDNNRANWQKAVEEEKMPWEQLLVDENKIEEVEQQFNFKAIPLVVFTDNRGKEVERFIGYDKDGKTNYATLIRKFIR